MNLEGTALFLVALHYLINGLPNMFRHLQICFTAAFHGERKGYFWWYISDYCALRATMKRTVKYLLRRI